MAPRKKKSAAGDPSPEPKAAAPDASAGVPESTQHLSTDHRSQPETELPGEHPNQRPARRRGNKKSGGRSVAVYEKMVGAMLSAYVLDAIGRLSLRRRELVELMSQEDPDWPFVIESAYGINRTLIRSVYALWTEHFSPAEAVLFVLRGLDCPGGKALEELVMEEFGP